MGLKAIKGYGHSKYWWGVSANDLRTYIQETGRVFTREIHQKHLSGFFREQAKNPKSKEGYRFTLGDCTMDVFQPKTSIHPQGTLWLRHYARIANTNNPSWIAWCGSDFSLASKPEFLVQKDNPKADIDNIFNNLNDGITTLRTRYGVGLGCFMDHMFREEPKARELTQAEKEHFAAIFTP